MHRRERCASAPMTMDRARASQTGACFEPGPASLSLKMTGTVRNSSRMTVMLTGRTTPSSGTES